MGRVCSIGESKRHFGDRGEGGRVSVHSYEKRRRTLGRVGCCLLLRLVIDIHPELNERITLIDSIPILQIKGNNNIVREYI